MKILLEPFDSEKKGYVWSCTQGSRVIIIVDDHYALPEWNYNPPNAHAYGLYEILEQSSQMHDTRAIGFFDLPSPDKIGAIQGMTQYIEKWILSLRIDIPDCKYYLLVDFFFGDGETSRDYGSHFVEHWRARNPFFVGGHLKIAHLSVGGTNASSHTQVFVRSKIHKKKLPPELLTWLDYKQKHTLPEYLWQNQEIFSWFANDTLPIMKHNASIVCEEFKDSEYAQSYKRNVEENLLINCHKDWWKSPTSIENIHNALKCLCGAYFCGQAEQGSGLRNISVGAAFLVAMMVHQEIYDHNVPFAISDIWINCSKSDSWVFPIQSKPIAQASVKALYDFFRYIFTPRQRSLEELKRQKASLVKRVVFDDDGRKLMIQVDWSSDEQKNLSAMLENLFVQDNVSIPRSPGNTREAVIRLWSQLKISKTGFGSPGNVYMDRDTIVIASNK